MKTLRSFDEAWARTGEHLLWVIGSGHETITRDEGYYYDCRKRFDAHIGIQLTLSGEGFYERGGKVTSLTRGMAFFDRLPGDFRYGYPATARAPYEHVWLDLTGDMALSLWQQVQLHNGPVLDLGPDNPVAPVMLSLVHQHALQMPLDRYQVSTRVYELIMLIFSVLSRSRMSTSPLVQRALERIHEHGLEVACTVSSLADALQCTREHLARSFSQATGVSPGEYLLQHRLRRVQQELRDTSDGLDRIAQRCGFSGANYLCRVFREQIGITPTVFRAKPWMIRPMLGTAPLRSVGSP